MRRTNVKEALAALAGKRSAATPRGARLAAPSPLPDQRSRPVKVQLPSGRWARGSIAPGAARRDDVGVLRQAIASNTTRAFGAIQHNARAIDALARSQRELATIMGELQTRGDWSNLESLRAQVSQLRRETKAQRRLLESQGRSQRMMGDRLRVLKMASYIEKLVSAVSSMQVAAFGTSGQLFARNNLGLASNEVAWRFAGDLLRKVGLSSLAWFTPLGSLLAGKAMLGKTPPQQRLISGLATEFHEELVGGQDPPRIVSTTSLEGRVPREVFSKLRNRTDVPVTVTSMIPLPDDIKVSAVVSEGTLIIELHELDSYKLYSPSVLSYEKLDEGPFVELRIAWIVDTGEVSS